jgi:hypothetical protein
MGKALTALAKEEDVLVIGSGLITHNLRDWRVFKKREVSIHFVACHHQPAAVLTCAGVVCSNGRWTLTSGSRKA